MLVSAIHTLQPGRHLRPSCCDSICIAGSFAQIIFQVNRHSYGSTSASRRQFHQLTDLARTYQSCIVPSHHREFQNPNHTVTPLLWPSSVTWRAPKPSAVLPKYQLTSRLSGQSAYWPGLLRLAATSHRSRFGRRHQMAQFHSSHYFCICDVKSPPGDRIARGAHRGCVAPPIWCFWLVSRTVGCCNGCDVCRGVESCGAAPVQNVKQLIRDDIHPRGAT